MEFAGKITMVRSGSIADQVGLVAGDILLTVDGTPVRDLIELSFLLAETHLSFEIRKQDGSIEVYDIHKKYDEEIGWSFDAAVFDKVRCCANRCVFCFVDQMPEGMRESLYVKDDDYRLSFLYGNFITLTNLGPKDWQRIRQFHLTPLFVSVQVTDGLQRVKMLNNPQAAHIMKNLERLKEYGIQFHCQVVLCPGFNDGKWLDQTIQDISLLETAALSIAIVPVGLTQFRDQCPQVMGFSSSGAAEVIEQVHCWQRKFQKERGETFVYLADEFYLAANKPIPEFDFYDGFPQLENGIGLVRRFLHEWNEQKNVLHSYSKPIYLDIISGVSFAKILEPLLQDMRIGNLIPRLVPVVNHFFGSQITVTGLLTGQDVLAHLKALPGPRDGIILPGVALRKDDKVFLDNMKPLQLAQELDTHVGIVNGAADLQQALRNWHSFSKV